MWPRTTSIASAVSPVDTRDRTRSSSSGGSESRTDGRMAEAFKVIQTSF